DNRDFYVFRERCELAGIRVPIVAGIMPITSKAGMVRMAELALGARIPAALLRAVGRCADDEAVARVGVHWATEQCRGLLDNGVRGLHFYTLNRSDATRQIYENLGVKDSAPLRAGCGRPAGRPRPPGSRPGPPRGPCPAGRGPRAPARPAASSSPRTPPAPGRSARGGRTRSGWPA